MLTSPWHRLEDYIYSKCRCVGRDSFCLWNDEAIGCWEITIISNVLFDFHSNWRRSCSRQTYIELQCNAAHSDSTSQKKANLCWSHSRWLQLRVHWRSSEISGPILCEQRILECSLRILWRTIKNGIIPSFTTKSRLPFDAVLLVQWLSCVAKFWYIGPSCQVLCKCAVSMLHTYVWLIF